MNERAPSMCPRCGDLIGSEDDSCGSCGLAVGGTSYRANAFWAFFRQNGSATGVLIGVMVVIFFAMVVVQGGIGFGMDGFLALRLLQCGALISKMALAGPVDYWRFVSAMFVHSGIWHLAMNCFVLFQLGPLCAHYFDQRRLFIIFLLSGIVGTVSSYFLIDVPLSVGASGGVLGVLTAILVRARQSAGAMDEMVSRQLMRWLVFILVIGFVVPRIDWAGHLGGIVGGAALGFLLGREGGRRQVVHSVLFVACILTALVCLGFAVRFAVVYHDDVTREIERRRNAAISVEEPAAFDERRAHRVGQFGLDHHARGGRRSV